MQYSVVCEKGLIRKINQDSVFAASDGHNGVFCIADGMGGHSKGEIASRVIVSKVEDCWKKLCFNKEAISFGDVFEIFKEVLVDANSYIFERYNKDAVCGSTVAFLLIFDSYYGIINVGDSRVYAVTRNIFLQETMDDVWENLPKQKLKENSEIIRSPLYGKLTNSVGTAAVLHCSYSINRLYGKKVFFLCSDGIYKLCDEAILKNIIRNERNPVEATNAIAEIVRKNGAVDNYSMIIVNVRDEKY